ncbi:MAG: dUTP diphosphatase [Polyangiaceae bacterium]|nr:dUTP diphosphatase [Polyangiaceae bacterium]
MRCKRTLPGDYPLPKHAKQGDAGLDLAMRRWRWPESKTWQECAVCLNPGDRLVVDTGIAMELPDGHVGFVQPRSGLARDHGVRTVTGTIDASYRGAIGVVLENFDEAPFEVRIGDRVAQIVVVPFLTCVLEEAESLSPSVRGTDGFGSSGLLALVGNEQGGSAA